MAEISFTLNNSKVSVDVEGDTPLLWVLRDTLNHKATKFSCGKGLCGACTIHVDGSPTRSCVLPVASIANRKVTTLEGIQEDSKFKTLQKQWFSSCFVAVRSAHLAAGCGSADPGLRKVHPSAEYLCPWRKLWPGRHAVAYRRRVDWGVYQPIAQVRPFATAVALSAGARLWAFPAFLNQKRRCR